MIHIKHSEEGTYFWRLKSDSWVTAHCSPMCFHLTIPEAGRAPVLKQQYQMKGSPDAVQLHLLFLKSCFIFPQFPPEEGGKFAASLMQFWDEFQAFWGVGGNIFVFWYVHTVHCLACILVTITLWLILNVKMAVLTVLTLKGITISVYL